MAVWPTGAELVTYFEDRGYPVITEAEGARLVGLAIREFESRTGRAPFLATSSEFEIDNQILESVTGYICDFGEGRGLIDDVSTVPEVVYVDLDGEETVLVNGQDFDYLPIGGGKDCEPWDAVRRRSGKFLARGFLRVSGLLGYCTSIPVDVTQAIYDYCVWRYAEDANAGQLVAAGGRVLKREKLGPSEVEYESVNTNSAMRSFSRVVELYSAW